MISEKVKRPWGNYIVIEEGNGYLIKTIQVNPFEKLSLQSHEYRNEHWVVLEGEAKVYLNNEVHYLKIGEHIDIKIGEKHSLENPYNNILRIVEVQRGEILSETDIIRYEDKYGRV